MYKDRQSALHAQLTSLEQTILQKQQLISELEDSQLSAREYADKLETRTKELEREKEMLQKRLNAVDESGQLSRAEIDAERQRRLEYEEQLQQAEVLHVLLSYSLSRLLIH